MKFDPANRSEAALRKAAETKKLLRSKKAWLSQRNDLLE
jgi:hypothetical protein